MKDRKGRRKRRELDGGGKGEGGERWGRGGGSDGTSREALEAVSSPWDLGGGVIDDGVEACVGVRGLRGDRGAVEGRGLRKHDFVGIEGGWGSTKGSGKQGEGR